MTNTAPVMDNALRLSGLARKLVTNDLLTEDQALQALDEGAKKNISFVAQLVESKTLDAYRIAEAGAYEFGVPLSDITAIDLDTQIIQLVDEKLVRKHQSLPLFKRGNHQPISKPWMKSNSRLVCMPRRSLRNRRNYKN